MRLIMLLTLGALAPAAQRDAFVVRLDGILVDQDPAEGVVRDSLFLHPDLDLRLAFPTGWAVQNGKQAVGAQEPKGAALVVLQAQERGDGNWRLHEPAPCENL